MTAPFQMTPLAVSAAAHHELLMTYVSQGFTRQEAMEILKLIMWYGMTKSGGDADGS